LTVIVSVAGLDEGAAAPPEFPPALARGALFTAGS
jgi:hypothetical protein